MRIVLMFAAVFIAVAPGRAEPLGADTSPTLEYLRDRWRNVQIRPLDATSAAYEFQEAPLFRWQNPISGADGAVFVWTAAGRPVLLCKCHVNDKKQIYVASSSSLATESFVARTDDKVWWRPREPGLVPAVVTEAAAPGNTDSSRLVQMRAIARRYRFVSDWGEDNPSEWQLRLLSTPLFRYSSVPAGIIDGAIFGYAQDTNPEAVVVIEAVKTGSSSEWRSAAVRLTGYALRGWMDDRQVLNVAKNNFTQLDGTYHFLHEKLPPGVIPKKSQ